MIKIHCIAPGRCGPYGVMFNHVGVSGCKYSCTIHQAIVGLETHEFSSHQTFTKKIFELQARRLHASILFLKIKTSVQSLSQRKLNFVDLHFFFQNYLSPTVFFITHIHMVTRIEYMCQDFSSIISSLNLCNFHTSFYC